MNWEQASGRWNQIKGSLKQEWGKLTDDDLDYIAGTKDRLIGRLQQKYGFAKEEAEQRADAWISSRDLPHGFA